MKRCRSGHSMGELVIVMILMTAILPPTLQTVHRAMTVSRQSQHELQRLNIVTRLAHQFRRDAQAAKEAELATAGAGELTMRLVSPDGQRVDYLTRPTEFVRREVDADGRERIEAFARYVSHQAEELTLKNPGSDRLDAHWSRSGEILELTLHAVPAERLQAEPSVRRLMTHVRVRMGSDHRHGESIADQTQETQP